MPFFVRNTIFTYTPCPFPKRSIYQFRRNSRTLPIPYPLSQSQWILPLQRNAFHYRAVLLVCLLEESHGWRWWQTCIVTIANAINPTVQRNLWTFPSRKTPEQKVCAATFTIQLLLQYHNFITNIQEKVNESVPSAMSFVLWRRKVPERIVTNPHISVTIWVGFCLSQSLYTKRQTQKLEQNSQNFS